MAYSSIISVPFPCPPEVVFEAISDMSKHPLWNSGMISISSSGRWRLGTRYQTESVAVGQRIISEVEVTQYQPHLLIELVSHSGAVTYDVTFRFERSSDNATLLECNIRFELANFVLKLAQPAIESMAESRLRGDLESLRALICEA